MSKLLAYLPPILKEVKEFRELMAAEQPELMALEQALGDTLNDQFINEATENGVLRWEKLLGIVPKATDSLQARKFSILSRINTDRIPFTLTSLKEQLKALCGENNYSVELDHNAYTLYIYVNLTAKSNYDDMDTLIRKIIPANLIYKSEVISQNLINIGGQIVAYAFCPIQCGSSAAICGSFACGEEEMV